MNHSKEKHPENQGDGEKAQILMSGDIPQLEKTVTTPQPAIKG